MGTALRLHFDGADGSTVFSDSAPVPNNIVGNGATAQSTAHAFKGSASLRTVYTQWVRCFGVGGQLVTGPEWSLHFAFRRDGTDANQSLFTHPSGNFQVATDGGGSRLAIRIARPSNGLSTIAYPDASPGDWHTLGASVCAGVLAIFFDGVRVLQDTGWGAVNFEGLALATYVDPYNPTPYWESRFTGYIDDVLLDNSQCLWKWGYDPMTLTPRDTYAPFAPDATARAVNTPPTWAQTLQLIAGVRAKMYDYGGLGSISGTVKIHGAPTAPARRRVRLYTEREMVCLGETWSDPVTGEYQFTGLKLGEAYTVLAHDHLRIYRAVAANTLQSEAV